MRLGIKNELVRFILFLSLYFYKTIKPAVTPMRKLLYIVLFLSVGKHLQATNYNCHTEAGQLQSLIGEQHRIITNLTVSGTIDGRDFAFINDSLFHLTGIDLADCTIDAFESRDIYLRKSNPFRCQLYSGKHILQDFKS